MNVDLKEIEFEEAYEVESIKKGKREPIFSKKNKKEIDSLKYESEESDYLIQMKIKVYSEKIAKEERIKLMLLTTQKNNLHRMGVYVLFIVIFSLLIVIIDKTVNLSLYTRISDIDIMDLKSVGVLFVYPVVALFFIGIIVCLAWIIVLLKRSAFTEDPHDNIKRRRETILNKCDDRIKIYENEICRLQMKLLHIK